MQCFYLLFLNKSVLFFALLSTPKKTVKSFYPNIETILSELYLEQKSCAIPFFLKAGQASEIKNTIYLIILFCYDSFHSGTESLVTSAGRGAKVRHID